ncbi:hypothetical protein NEPAR07_1942 [Nematocida parisii]|nr:hypothetical protein NEPAR07_1942 [Nematocida parisii]
MSTEVNQKSTNISEERELITNTVTNNTHNNPSNPKLNIFINTTGRLIQNGGFLYMYLIFSNGNIYSYFIVIFVYTLIQCYTVLYQYSTVLNTHSVISNKYISYTEKLLKINNPIILYVYMTLYILQCVIYSSIFTIHIGIDLFSIITIIIRSTTELNLFYYTITSVIISIIIIIGITRYNPKLNNTNTVCSIYLSVYIMLLLCIIVYLMIIDKNWIFASVRYNNIQNSWMSEFINGISICMFSIPVIHNNIYTESDINIKYTELCISIGVSILYDIIGMLEYVLYEYSTHKGINGNFMYGVSEVFTKKLRLSEYSGNCFGIKIILLIITVFEFIWIFLQINNVLNHIKRVKELIIPEISLSVSEFTDTYIIPYFDVDFSTVMDILISTCISGIFVIISIITYNSGFISIIKSFGIIFSLAFGVCIPVLMEISEARGLCFLNNKGVRGKLCKLLSVLVICLSIMHIIYISVPLLVLDSSGDIISNITDNV